MVFLPQVDEIIMLENGRVVEMGTYDELMERRGAFHNFVGNYDPDTDLIKDMASESDSNTEEDSDYEAVPRK